MVHFVSDVPPGEFRELTLGEVMALDARQRQEGRTKKEDAGVRPSLNLRLKEVHEATSSAHWQQGSPALSLRALTH